MDPPLLYSDDHHGPVAPDNPVDEVRHLLARWRQERGEEIPTLGRLFPDTPGVRFIGDSPPTARLIALERWAMEDPEA